MHVCRRRQALPSPRLACHPSLCCPPHSFTHCQERISTKMPRGSFARPSAAHTPAHEAPALRQCCPSTVPVHQAAPALPSYPLPSRTQLPPPSPLHTRTCTRSPSVLPVLRVASPRAPGCPLAHQTSSLGSPHHLCVSGVCVCGQRECIQSVHQPSKDVTLRA